MARISNILLQIQNSGDAKILNNNKV